MEYCAHSTINIDAAVNLLTNHNIVTKWQGLKIPAFPYPLPLIATRHRKGLNNYILIYQVWLILLE